MGVWGAERRFNSIMKSPRIEALGPLLVLFSLAAALLAAIGSDPGDVDVTLTNALRNSTTIVSSGANDPTDEIAPFSSRGTTNGANAKPVGLAPTIATSMSLISALLYVQRKRIDLTAIEDALL